MGERRGPNQDPGNLTLDPNTANRQLSLSEGNRKVTHTWTEEPYPDHPVRFEHRLQVVCRESVSERCYWEAEWSVSERGWVCIAVTYEGISRKGGESHCAFGWNKNSWSLECDEHSYSVRHNEKQTDIPVPPSPCRRAGVCDDDDDDYITLQALSRRFHSERLSQLLHSIDDDDDDDDGGGGGEGVSMSRVGVCADGLASHPSFCNIPDWGFRMNISSFSPDCIADLSDFVCHNEGFIDTLARPSPYCRLPVIDDDADGGRGVCVYRVGVYVDRPAGTLSFYSVSDSDTLTLLHRFHTHFTQHTPLCAGFYVYDSSSVSLCQLE